MALPLMEVSVGQFRCETCGRDGLTTGGVCLRCHADGEPLPDRVTGPVFVCYADGVDRRVVRLWPTSGRRGRGQWGGQGGDVEDGLYAWGACAAPGASVIHVSRREFANSRAHAVLNWCQCEIGEQEIDMVAEEWRVSPDAIREAMNS